MTSPTSDAAGKDPTRVAREVMKKRKKALEALRLR